MVERRTTERRKRASEFRANVTRLEFEQLSALVERVAETTSRLEQELRAERERVSQLQREVDALTARAIARSKQR